MLKKVITILLLLFALPVFAGEYENALKDSDIVFLYLYSKTCKYCQGFDAIYNKLERSYNKKCKFVKVDVDTPYGMYLGKTFGVRFVPFTVMVKQTTKIATGIPNSCITDYACSEKVVKEFISGKE